MLICILLPIVFGVGFWQYTRIFEVYKDIYEHHNEDCRHIAFPGYVQDLTRVNRVLLGIVKDPVNSSPSLVSFHDFDGKVR